MGANCDMEYQVSPGHHLEEGASDTIAGNAYCITPWKAFLDVAAY